MNTTRNKNTRHKNLKLRSHNEMANRLYAAAKSVASVPANETELHLREMANEHRRASAMTGDQYLG